MQKVAELRLHDVDDLRWKRRAFQPWWRAICLVLLDLVQLKQAFGPPWILWSENGPNQHGGVLSSDLLQEHVNQQEPDHGGAWQQKHWVPLERHPSAHPLGRRNFDGRLRNPLGKPHQDRKTEKVGTPRNQASHVKQHAYYRRLINWTTTTARFWARVGVRVLGR